MREERLTERNRQLEPREKTEEVEETVGMGNERGRDPLTKKGTSC